MIVKYSCFALFTKNNLIKNKFTKKLVEKKTFNQMANSKRFKLLINNNTYRLLEISPSPSRQFILAQCMWLALSLFTFLAIFTLLHQFGLFDKFHEIDFSQFPKSVNLTSDLSHNANAKELNHTFLYNAQSACDKRPPFLVILVKTKVTNFKQRVAIRKTWGQQDQFGYVRRVFVVGMPNPKENKENKTSIQLEAENARYNDIIQLDFVDDYRKIVIKTLMTYRWISEFCSSVNTFILVYDLNLVIN